MAVLWHEVDLVGTKDGVNTSFQLPDVPEGVTLLLIHNGRFLYRVPGTPNFNQYFQSGNIVTLGLAPVSTDNLWAWYSTTGTVLTPASVPFQSRKDFYWTIELRNKQGELVEVLQKDVYALAWQYDTVGGCGECEIGLRRLFDDFGDIDLDYDVQLWRGLNPLGVLGTRLPAVLPFALGTTFAGARELWYSGFVRDILPVLDERESVRLRCSGYSRQLEYLVVPDRTYENLDVGEIARQIIDEYVLPGAQIKRTVALALVQDSGITVSSVHFDGSAWEALRALADIGGNCEWGVRADKEIFFIPRQNTVRQTFVIGDRIKLYESGRSSDDVVNRVFLRGGNGTKFTLSNGAYETGFQKERVVTASYVNSESDATLFGLSYFAKFGESQSKGRLSLAASDDWIENVGPPMGLLRVFGGPLFIPGGARLEAELPVELGKVLGKTTDHTYRISGIQYAPRDNALATDIALGEKGSGITDLFRAIEYKLTDLRNL